jgi:hypothetical protein
MNENAHPDLQRTLRITVEMLDAAANDNWDRVIQLEEKRQYQLRKHRVNAMPLTDLDRQIIATVRKHNQTLAAHADLAQSALKQQLDQQQYNRRALRTYISSSPSR